MAKHKDNKLGSWSFLIGVIVAVLFGFFGQLSTTLLIVLVVIGLIVGLLNVTDEESTPFLLSGTALVIVSSLGGSVLGTVSSLAWILDALLVLFVPATIVVAIRNVFHMAKH